MDIFLNGPGSPPRILLLGGTSEIGLAILSALAAPAGTEVILAGRDEQRLAAAGKELRYRVRTVPYDAMDTGGTRPSPTRSSPPARWTWSSPRLAC